MAVARLSNALEYLTKKYKVDRQGNVYKTISKDITITVDKVGTDENGRAIYKIDIVKDVLTGDSGVINTVLIKPTYNYVESDSEMYIAINGEQRHTSKGKLMANPYPVVIDKEDSAFILAYIKPSGSPENFKVDVDISIVERAIHEQIKITIP